MIFFQTCWGPKPGHLKTHQCWLKAGRAAGRQKAVAQRQAAWEQCDGWRAAGGWATAGGLVTADGWQALDGEQSILIDLSFCSWLTHRFLLHAANLLRNRPISFIEAVSRKSQSALRN